MGVPGSASVGAATHMCPHCSYREYRSSDGGVESPIAAISTVRNNWSQRDSRHWRCGTSLGYAGLMCTWVWADILDI